MFSTMFSFLAEAGVKAAETIDKAAEIVENSASPGMHANLGVLWIVIGVGMIVFCAAFGLSKIVSSMSENIARQPESAAHIRAAAMLLGFLFEGISLFACVILIIASGKIT